MFSKEENKKQYCKGFCLGLVSSEIISTNSGEASECIQVTVFKSPSSSSLWVKRIQD